MVHGDPDALHSNPHGQWHEHPQEPRIWRNAPVPVQCQANNTIRRIMTASRQDTEKILNHDAAAALGHQMVVVGPPPPPTVSMSANASVPTYMPNAQ